MINVKISEPLLGFGNNDFVPTLSTLHRPVDHRHTQNDQHGNKDGQSNLKRSKGIAGCRRRHDGNSFGSCGSIVGKLLAPSLTSSRAFGRLVARVVAVSKQSKEGGVASTGSL